MRPVGGAPTFVLGSVLAVAVASFCEGAGAATTPAPPAVEAPAPEPSMVLTVYAPSARSPWRVRVVNTGSVPLRLTADARLLSLDLYVPDVRAPLHCALPADMRPSNDVDRALIVPPRRSYSETIDPRLLCFGARETAALAPGTTVVAHLGWAAPPAPATPARSRPRPSRPPPRVAPPFVVSPLEGVEPKVAPRKELTAAAFTLPADAPAPTPSDASSPAAGRLPTEPFPTRLALSVPAHIESWSPFELSIPVTVKNEGTRPVTFLFRSQTLGFDVLGPSGAERCVWPTSPGAPIREMYTVLAPGGRATRSVLLENVCTGNSLDQGGLFIVRPRLDTRGATGGPIGLHTFDGEVLGTGTVVMRLHRGREAQRAEPPRLDPP
jgi:hypothetical protein